MWFLTRTLISGAIIAVAAWLAGKNPILAGFIIALPLMSMLSILFSWVEYHDMAKINKFAVSILTAVPLSLVFFIPFLLNRWMKMNFPLTYGLAVVFLAGAYFAHSMIMKLAAR